MYVRRLIVATCLCLAVIGATAQEMVVSSGESVGAAGIATVSVTNNMRSVNPSLMGEVERLAVAVSYAQPYGLSDLTQVSGKVVGATPLVNLTLQVVKSGSDDSHFTEIGGGLSRVFGKWGMGVEYYAIIHSLWNGRRYSSSFSRIGLHFKPSEKWLISVALHSVEQRDIVYETTETSIKARSWLGLKWNASSLFAVMIEAEKPWNEDMIGKLALAIYPIDKLDVTVGFSSIGQSLSAGIGYAWNGADIRVGMMHHERLGVTLGATVGYTLGRGR